MPGSVRNFLLLIALLLGLSACDVNSLYNENISIADGKWYKNEAAHFEVSVPDSTEVYDFYLNLRNRTDYRFSNLYIFMVTRFPNGNMTRDTIEIFLADKQGKWLGKGWGNLKDNSILLKEGLRFPLTGKYEFFIQQAMRTDTLEGITDIGLQISRSVN